MANQKTVNATEQQISKYGGTGTGTGTYVGTYQMPMQEKKVPYIPVPVCCMS